ncbi:hypothetical protein DdX_03650 [Ditylenchus destructor]|uniref:Uncharacterized protein n=1 Tax=Ditylenchus destructor TaxID=166010 RepID=A0AAD4RBE4_9BILA|nr:hypothetical protein DdX_03650 [Ditylenchus destructor]
MSRRGSEWVNTIAYNLRVKRSTSSGYCYRELLSNITMNAAETCYGAVVLAMCSRNETELAVHNSNSVCALSRNPLSLDGGNEKEEMAQSTTVGQVNTSSPRVWVADAYGFIWPEFSAYESSHKNNDTEESLYYDSIWPIRQIPPSTRSYKLLFAKRWHLYWWICSQISAFRNCIQRPQGQLMYTRKYYHQQHQTSQLYFIRDNWRKILTKGVDIFSQKSE